MATSVDLPPGGVVVPLPPGVIVTEEEIRRQVEGEMADQGSVQVVMTHHEFWRYKRWVQGSQRELYEIEGGRPDLPTYGTRYTRRYT